MATKLSYNIPNGSTLQIAQTMGASVAVTGITNAKEAVASISAEDSSIAAGDYVQLFTSWVNMSGLVARVKSVTSGKVTLELVDTSDTDIYPEGGGAGTLVKIQAWIDLPLTPTISNSGNEQQTTTFQAIQHERAVNINTYKSAATQTFTMAHDASLPVREVLKNLDRTQDITAFKFYNKRAKETRVYGCQVSFNEIPASEVNNVETNSLVLSLVSEMVIYPVA